MNNFNKLMQLLQSKNIETAAVARLIKTDATIFNKENSDNCTPLIVAIQNKQKIEIINLLINTETINHESKKGLTALMGAVKNKDWIAVEKLIALGANIDYENKSGFTALMTSVKAINKKNEKDIIKIIKLLITKNAVIEFVVNNFGHTILYYAEKNEKVLKILNDEIIRRKQENGFQVVMNKTKVRMQCFDTIIQEANSLNFENQPTTSTPRTLDLSSKSLF